MYQHKVYFNELYYINAKTKYVCAIGYLINRCIICYL